MNTRLQNNIVKPKHLHLTTTHPLPDFIEPTCALQAIRHPHWKQAMLDEYTTLTNNETWELVPPLPDKTIVGYKWIFCIKRHLDGSISRYKARLVAKGFTQRPGLDFTETFSPVVKPVTIRLVLCLTVSNNWRLHQLDVNNSFLQGKLTKEVYMQQPSVLYDTTKPHHVCKLKKAICGLKQAPRAWYQALSSFFLSFGFTQSVADASLFIYHCNGITAYLLVYVDDLILTGNHTAFLCSFIQHLASQFSIKDLGSLHYFLGIEVVLTAQGFFLSQHRYISDILIKTGMSGAKASTTPISTTTRLCLHDGSATADDEAFRKIVGCLQYLVLTRLDICFVVNKLSQFMHKPSTLHFQALKRVLRYLKRTLFHGLFIKKELSPSLQVFTNSDWAGSPNDKTSTSVFIIYLGGTPVSWSLKKQKAFARSSSEAEYRAISTAVSEATWIQSLLHELQLVLPSSPSVYCDNLSATYTCKNSVFHTKMKHLQLDFFFVREKIGVTNGATILRGHISVADKLTSATATADKPAIADKPATADKLDKLTSVTATVDKPATADKLSVADKLIFVTVTADKLTSTIRDKHI
ncbi:Cysteine-rich RLK (RECEPTOR-like protein kinase) 8 [Theobroma cacao]|uniref:Cysteine-rich RLK (RECEPTOR-like protein kinase) 8 n=1 Tax=Theobroma cacao TaxID=3641 RepID=A0A061FIH2_THECC|nr:Cysteine-rich RLK (RECEPTOR-like protein kinase) 8 [Theobroma cacao]